MTKLIVSVGLLFAMASAMAVWAQAPPSAPTAHPAQTEPKKEEPKPNEIDAPKPWVEKYQQFLTIQNLINELEKENGITALRDKAQSLGNDLQKDIPPDYTFIPQSQNPNGPLKFVLRPAAPTPPPKPAEPPRPLKGEKKP